MVMGPGRKLDMQTRHYVSSFNVRHNQSDTDKTEWYVDSGATAHMTGIKPKSSNLEMLDTPISIDTSNGARMWGMARMETIIQADQAMKLEVIYVPNLRFNVISVTQLTQEGHEISFIKDTCEIHKDNRLILTCNWNQGGYVFKEKQEKQIHCNVSNLTNDLIVDKKLMTSNPEDWKDIQKLPNPEKQIWIKAMQEEINRFDKSEVWEKCQLPRHKTAIGCRWTCKKKQMEDENKVKIRARLVAQGCHQTYPDSFENIYSPVVQPSTIRVALTLGAMMDLHNCHFDIDSAFLYGILNEQIYMKTPAGPWSNVDQEEVYRLKKSIYGLRQAAKDWHQAITTSLLKIGYKPSKYDQCLFTPIENETFSIILIHVDDILVFSKKKETIDFIHHELANSYSIKNLGPVKNYLGMEIHQNEKGTYQLTQKEKILDLTKLMHLNHQDKHWTPMTTSQTKPENKPEELNENNKRKYQSLIGSLLYIANYTRPDISLSVNILSRSCQKPTSEDWNRAIRVVKYLNQTQNYSLSLGKKGPYNLISYADSDWAGDPNTRQSTSGEIHLLGENLISWKTTRQKTVALSTSEAEYTATVECSKQTIWLKSLLIELCIIKETPVEIKNDNQSCIHLAQSFKDSKRMKHIQVKIGFLRELIDNGVIHLSYCNTLHMLADLLTKPLPKDRHWKLTKLLGINSV